MPLELSRSRDLMARAQRVIPAGIYGHQSPRLMVAEAYPSFIEKGEGCRIWDVDGNAYIDYICSYGPIVLGHRHPAVEAAAEEQRKKGSSFNLPGKVFVELAELLVEKTPFADWALFAKNGSDVTSWSLSVAREHTGRRKILMAHGAYHGVHPWCNPNPAGTVEEERLHIVEFEYNDLEDLREKIEKHKDDLAGIIVTPFRHDAGRDQELPLPDFHPTIRTLCDEHGLVYILDDVRCGFRLDLAGSGNHYGVEPDLSCYCKALGNGYPISACVGREAFRAAAERTFTTGSYWTGPVEMAAAVATLRELEQTDACDRMGEYGAKLMKGLEEQAARYDLQVRVTGEPQLPYMSFVGDQKSERLRLWCVECLERSVFFHPRHNWFLSAAHGEAELEETLEATRAAFELVRDRFGPSAEG